MSLKNLLDRLKESWHQQKEFAKFYLRAKWEEGASQGKGLKEKHKKILEKKIKKGGNK